jgi:hypothetical protein
VNAAGIASVLGGALRVGRGAKAIAGEINRTVRQSRYLIEKKALPVRRLESDGTKAMLVASRRRLRGWLVGAK